MRAAIYQFYSRQRMLFRTGIWIVLTWLFLVIANFVLKQLGVNTGSPLWFPISVFSGPTIHIPGLPFLLLFFVILYISLKYAPKMGKYRMFAACLTLILLGNLGQGSFDLAFLRPFYDTNYQYYHDAIKITAWQEWLRSFNTNQPNLLVHSRTHPPFAVLIHFFLLQASHGNILVLAGTFLLIASLSILIVGRIFEVLDVFPLQLNLLMLLFSVIPAVNIYSAVSYDGLIMTTASVFLLGIMILQKQGRITTSGLLLTLLGFVLTNLLTYGGIYLLLVGGLLAAREVILKKKFSIVISLAVSCLAFFILIFFMDKSFGYNHLMGFMTASRLENPEGFRGFIDPVEYLFTRLECISEPMLFFSLGCLAMYFHLGKRGINLTNYREDEIATLLAGLMSLLAMFLAGAFRTGETARVCLFIFPYLLLPFRRLDQQTTIDLILMAGIQTAGMQLLGNYFW